MTLPKKNWRHVKRAVVLKGIAWLLGIGDHVVTRQVVDTYPEPGLCSREPYHEGPCNGYAVESCFGYEAMMTGGSRLA